MIFLLGCTPETEFSGNSEHAIVNHGFESFAESLDGWYSVEGWHGKEGGISNDRYFTPVEGAFFAALKSSDNWISQQLDISVEAGKTYTLTAWARSINQAGNGAATIAEIGMFANGEVVTSVKEEVGVQELKGVAALVQNDDGANVWIDGNYRHQFADIHMFQTIDSDPIVDPWVEMENSNYLTLNGLGWAVGNVIAGDQKYIYGTIYKDNRDDFYSSITMTKVTGEVGSNYTWADPIVLIDHKKTEFPWVEDAHVFYDKSADRLWMTWGGGICYVTELDPESGHFLHTVSDTEYDSHPKRMHHTVATWPETHEGWCGDDWSSCWMEGASIFKHGDYWYLFSSYGNMDKNYTIRMGKGNAPIGPFYDKYGIDMMEFDPERKVYGNSMLLGDEGIQLVPGHPHMWQEGEKYFMGYDYRKETKSNEPGDYMGIRRIYWKDGWPTVWTPIEVRMKADNHSDLIGKKLAIGFRNVGEQNSVLAIDDLKLSID